MIRQDKEALRLLLSNPHYQTVTNSRRTSQNPNNNPVSNNLRKQGKIEVAYWNVERSDPYTHTVLETCELGLGTRRDVSRLSLETDETRRLETPGQQSRDCLETL